MRTYEPADDILYVHMAQDPAAGTAPRDSRGACHRLPAGYANRSLETCLAGPQRALAGSGTGAVGSVSARPALVVIPGGAGQVHGRSQAAARQRSA
jgi:hypothetical protein